MLAAGGKTFGAFKPAFFLELFDLGQQITQLLVVFVEERIEFSAGLGVIGYRFLEFGEGG